MELFPGTGIEQLNFGMEPHEVVAILGEPDKVWAEADPEEQEEIYQYNRLRLRLTFFHHEGGKLGFIRCSNPTLRMGSRLILNTPVNEVKEEILRIPKQQWEVDDMESFQTHSFYPLWIILTSEYETVIQVEMGVPWKDDDNYDWPQTRD